MFVTGVCSVCVRMWGALCGCAVFAGGGVTKGGEGKGRVKGGFVGRGGTATATEGLGRRGASRGGGGGGGEGVEKETKRTGGLRLQEEVFCSWVRLVLALRFLSGSCASLLRDGPL